MRILVTGGAGFIGNHLCTALASANHEVVSVDAAGSCRDPRVASFVGSVGDFMHDVNLWRVIPNLMNIIERPHPGFDAIIHLAAISQYGTVIERPGEVLTNNYVSTLNLLEYCRRHPFTRFMYISNGNVAFDDVTENPQALSKLQCEQLVSLYRQTFDVMSTTVRLFSVFGPGERAGQHGTLFRRCQECILSGTHFEVNGDGTQVRDFTHVADVVLGLKAVLGELMDGSIRSTCKPLYELGASNARYSVNDIVREFSRGTTLKVRQAPRRRSEPHLTMADPALRPAGWLPRVDPLSYIVAWKEHIAKDGDPS